MERKIGEVSLYYIKKDVDSVKITSSIDAEKFLRKVYDERTFEHKESFYVLALDNSNNVIDYSKICDGGITGCLVDVRMVFQFLLIKNAVGFVLSHNHPSGSLKPSNADISLTQKIKTAGEHLDIKLLDHIIMTKESFVSLADEGRL